MFFEVPPFFIQRVILIVVFIEFVVDGTADWVYAWAIGVQVVLFGFACQAEQFGNLLV